MCKVTTDTDLVAQTIALEVDKAVRAALDARVGTLIESQVPSAVRGALLRSLGWIIGIFGLTIVVAVYSMGSWSTSVSARINSLEVAEADRKEDSKVLQGLARDMDWITGRATNRLLPNEGETPQ